MIQGEKLKKVCFFDMDGTLIAGNSGVSFMRYSYARGKTSLWRVGKSIIDYLRYRYNLLNMEKAYRQSLRPLIGVREEELIKFCYEWFAEQVEKLIYPEVKELVRQHQENGEITVIISNATIYAIQPLAEHLGIPHVLGTLLQLQDGRFTGDFIAPLCFGQGKIFWAQKLMQKINSDFAFATFYTDSITDLPLLELVKNPQIVNPDPKLRALAKRRGWPLRDFRKLKVA
ncbi:MAG: HAD family hydrolase [Thermodesulfobacteriota bacterium]